VTRAVRAGFRDVLLFGRRLDAAHEDVRGNQAKASS